MKLVVINPANCRITNAANIIKGLANSKLPVDESGAVRTFYVTRILISTIKFKRKYTMFLWETVCSA